MLLILRTEGSSNECCYDNSGQLIIGPTSGGSVDKASPIGSDSSNYLSSLLSHHREDILPYIYCCKGLATVCEKYYTRRPSDNGTAYVPPIPGKFTTIQLPITEYYICSLDHW